MNRWRILCINGGGILGLIAAVILAEIEARVGKLAGQLFDLVSGTSTGGIIASAAAAGIPAKDVAELYRQRGKAIFSKNLWHRLVTGFGLWGPQYGAKGIKSALAGVFGDLMLSDCTAELLVPAYDIGARAPLLFKSSKAREPRRNYFLRDVCRATSAAPTYFPPARIASQAGDMATLVDGGLYANNPAALALPQAAKSNRLGEVFMVSLGTGDINQPYLYSDAKGWGLAQWARPLIGCMFDGQSDVSSYGCEVLLGSRYVRLQPALAKEQAMDDVSGTARETLEAVARGLIAERDAELDRICEMLLPKAA